MSTILSITRAEELRPGGKPILALTKQEASEWLRELGEEPRVAWTSREIKSRIKEILDLLAEEEHGKLPKNLTGMKQADLQRECAERNLHFTDHETKGSMIRMIREQAKADACGKSGTIMGFGRFHGLTDEEVAHNYPAYVKWARETVKEEGLEANAMLRKFVRWLHIRPAVDKALLETRIKDLDHSRWPLSNEEADARLRAMADLASYRDVGEDNP